MKIVQTPFKSRMGCQSEANETFDGCLAKDNTKVYDTCTIWDVAAKGTPTKIWDFLFQNKFTVL